MASLMATLILVFAVGFAGVAYQWRRAEIAVTRESFERREAERQRMFAATQADLAQQRSLVSATVA